MNTHSHHFEFRVSRQPFACDELAIYAAFVSMENGIEKIRIAESPVLHALNPDEANCQQAPTLTVKPSEAQQLMDELWRAGLRPTEGTGSAGSLAATERHLADMRALVFKKLPADQLEKNQQ